MLKKNIGGADKYIRIILGLVGVGIGFYFGYLWATLIGAVLFFTGWYGWCGLYSLFGLSTLRKYDRN